MLYLFMIAGLLRMQARWLPGYTGGEDLKETIMSKKYQTKEQKRRFWVSFGVSTAIGLALIQPVTLFGVAICSGIGYLVGKTFSGSALDTTPRNEPNNQSVHYRTQEVRATQPEAARPVTRQPETITGNAAADDVIRRGRAMIGQIRSENIAITDPVLTAQMNELEQRCSQIFQTVQDSPEKASQIRKFMDYYLPTTLKMLASYRTMAQRGVSYGTLLEARDSLVKAMDMVLTATRKLQDNLFRGEMLDISTDIDVLEQMLVRDGFKEPETSAGAKGTAAVQQMQSTGAPVMDFPEEDTAPASYFTRKKKQAKTD